MPLQGQHYGNRSSTMQMEKLDELSSGVRIRGRKCVVTVPRYPWQGAQPSPVRRLSDFRRSFHKVRSTKDGCCCPIIGN